MANQTLGPGRLKWHLMTASNMTLAAFNGTPVLVDGVVVILQRTKR
jgi:hypothetical protein